MKIIKRFRAFILDNRPYSGSNSDEEAKLEMFFNIASLSTFFYLLTIASKVYHQYWYAAVITVIGIILFSTIFVSLKRSKNLVRASFLFMLASSFISISSLIVNAGETSYSIFALAIAIVPFMFLMLPKFGGYLYLVFCVIFISISLAITFGYWHPIDVGIDFSHDRKYYRNPNLLTSTSPLFILIYLLYEFTSAERKASQTLIKQKELAVQNKLTIEDKNKAIHANIHYASEIQKSLLPENKKLNAIFKENFVLFKPVDQLSGDLYWMAERDDTRFFAVIDSSESGVSGSLISFICHNTLNRAINEANVKRPSEILEYVNNYLASTLNREKRRTDIKLTVCSYEVKSKVLTYSGENNPLYVLQKGNITELKSQLSDPEKLQSHTSFRDQQLTLAKDDIIYLFSDGYANQNKNMSSDKLKASVFKQLLLSVHEDSMAQQKKKLNSKLNEWLNFESQTDDVCILGLKVP